MSSQAERERLEALESEFKVAKGFLDRKGVMDGTLNPVALKMASLVKDAPHSMSFALANFTMATYAGHFHFKINLGETNKVPVNVIYFILAKSGAKKTSSVIKMRKSLQSGTDMINNHRQELLNAKLAEVDAPKRNVNPLTNAIPTEQGMARRLNEFAEEGIGMPSLFVDEISTELQTSGDIIAIIKLISQLFDNGDCDSRPLKDQEAQLEEIRGMGMPSLFIGSEHGILEDEAILKKFITEFISKLARRCCFVYPTFKKTTKKVTSEEELLNNFKNKEDTASETAHELNRIAIDLVKAYMLNDKNELEVSDEANDLYIFYMKYCEYLAEGKASEPLILEQEHRHWKAFKLAGVYAVFDQSDTIEFIHLKQAINAVESIEKDLEKFLNKASRNVYEMVAEYFLEGGADITIHEMIKLGWIKKEAHLKDIIVSANSKIGNEGVVAKIADKLTFSRFEKTDEGVGCSFKKLPSLNEKIGKHLANGLDMKEAIHEAKTEWGFIIFDGYKYNRNEFSKLKNVLSNDCGFSPYRFMTKDEGATYNEKKNPNPNGCIKGKENIIGGADFIVLDVDNDGITIDEAADLFCDFNYLMARSSDKDNPYKFRILMPTDITLNLDRTKYRQFMQKVSDYVGVKIDILPQSQIYYGYSGREVIENYDGEAFPASEIIKTLTTEVKKIKVVPENIRAKIWEDRKNEFHYAYELDMNEGPLHLSLRNAMLHARDLGYSYEENIELIQDIVDNISRDPRDDFWGSLESQRKEAYGMDKWD